MTQNSIADNRMVWLDVVRCVAMLMVIGVHCIDPFYISPTMRVIPEYTHWAAIYGSLLRPSVPLFVMMTGLLLLPVRQQPLGTFYKKRIFRVLFPFLIWSVLYSMFPWFTGLLGLPNAGKSTFLSRVSAARPKIADYPFTTLTPNLGVLIDEYDPDHRMVIADIPGLIEGAHAGQGLGDRFLRHVERTRFLVHILSVEDVQPDGENPWAGFDLINEELALFDPELARRRQIEVINKIDLRAPEELDIIRARAEADGRRMFFISARDGEGLEELTAELWRLRDELDRHEALVRFAEEEEEAGEFPEIEVEWVRE